MTIRKFRAGRVANADVSSWVGEPGTMFYDEETGQLKIADGTTPGGHYINLVIATPTQAGAIKAGPGANVAVDGTLTIDTTGIPLSVGDLYITGANISAVNANEDLNLITSGTGDINIVGNLHVHTTSQGPNYPTPILEARNTGNVYVNGNLITNGGTYHNGSVTFTGETTHTGNLVTNGDVIVNGASYFFGNITEIGNLTITGDAINNGKSVFNGDIRTVGNTTMVGNVVQAGNLTITGTTINNGLSVFNGNIAMVGNAVISGNTTITGIARLTGNSYIIGNTFVTGTATLTGNSYITGNTFVTGPTTVTGNLSITGNSIQTGQAAFVVSTNNMNTGGVEITGNVQGLVQPPALPGVMLHVTGQDNGTTPGRSYFDGVGQYAILVGRRYNGTIANPTQALAGDEVLRIAGTGYPTGGWPLTGLAQIRYIADENQTQTNRGGHIDFLTVPIGSNVVTQVMSVSATSGVTVSGNVTATNFFGTATQVSSNLTAGYGLKLSSGTTYNGSTALTINKYDTVTGPVTATGAGGNGWTYTLDLGTATGTVIVDAGGNFSGTVTLNGTPVVGKLVRLIVIGGLKGATTVTVTNLTAANSSNGLNTFTATTGTASSLIVEFISTTTALTGVYMSLPGAK